MFIYGDREPHGSKILDSLFKADGLESFLAQHLDGLNLSRAWMLERLAAALDDPVLHDLAAVHRTAGLELALVAQLVARQGGDGGRPVTIGSLRREQVADDDEFEDLTDLEDESDLLVDGEVDALFHAVEPRAFLEGHPKVARLWPDHKRVEQAYFRKTGIFPIMHAVAMRKDVIEEFPWLPKAVFNAYSQAKQIMYDQLKKMGWATISLPWVAKEIEETRVLMGDNFWPYGIKLNRKALETLIQYSYEQGLASRKLTIEEVFHPSTMTLEE